MTYLPDLLGTLSFRSRSLQALAARGSLISGFIGFSLGFLAFVLVRNTVYADLPELTARQYDAVTVFLNLNLIQAVLFVALVYVPAIALLSKAISGDGPAFPITSPQYRAHGSALLPLWGLLLLIAAPVQYFAPQFLVVKDFGISVGLFVLLLLLAAYTVWSIRELNRLSVVQALGAFLLSWFTLPIFYLLISSLLVLLFFAVIPVIYLGWRRISASIAVQKSRQNEKGKQGIHESDENEPL